MIIKMLKLLSTLEIGDTINVSSMSKVSHKSYVTATTRWLYGENRHRTITMIEEEVTSVLLQLHKVFSFSLCYDLSEAYQGIQNLSMTYQDDRDSISRLRKCMDAIEKYLQSVGHFNLLELKKKLKPRIMEEVKRDSYKASESDKDKMDEKSHVENISS